MNYGISFNLRIINRCTGFWSLKYSCNFETITKGTLLKYEVWFINSVKYRIGNIIWYFVVLHCLCEMCIISKVVFRHLIHCKRGFWLTVMKESTRPSGQKISIGDSARLIWLCALSTSWIAEWPGSKGYCCIKEISGFLTRTSLKATDMWLFLFCGPHDSNHKINFVITAKFFRTLPIIVVVPLAMTSPEQ